MKTRCATAIPGPTPVSRHRRRKQRRTQLLQHNMSTINGSVPIKEHEFHSHIINFSGSWPPTPASTAVRDFLLSDPHPRLSPTDCRLLVLLSDYRSGIHAFPNSSSFKLDEIDASIRCFIDDHQEAGRKCLVALAALATDMIDHDRRNIFEELMKTTVNLLRRLDVITNIRQNSSGLLEFLENFETGLRTEIWELDGINEEIARAKEHELENVERLVQCVRRIGEEQMFGY